MEHIDLHLHSSFSDGTDTPEEIVSKAKKAGIGLIALTDHNTLAGIHDFRLACHKYGQTGIDGIELSTGYPEPGLIPGREKPEIHVLGYFPPDTDFSSPSCRPLHRTIEEYRNTKIRHNESMVRKMEEAGIGKGHLTVSGFNNFVRKLSDSGNYNRVHIARYLMHLDIVESISQAMNIYIGKKSPYYVIRETITTAEAIRAVHAAGGSAVVAHLGEYHMDGERLESFFDYCMKNDIDGFELLHPHNTPRTVSQILAFAERFRRQTGRVLLLTAGSDYHGSNKLNRQAFPWLDSYAWK